MDCKPYGIIYKIINTDNQKVYIGQTIKNIKKRFEQHIYTAMNFTKKRTKFYIAIRKYGRDKFIYEQIDIAYTKEELNEKESHHITVYNSYKKGYNSTLGGDDNPMNNDEVRIKQKINVKGKGHKFKKGHTTFLGKSHLPETKKKMSEHRLGHVMEDKSKKKLSETRKRLGLGQKGGKDHHSNVIIVQLNKDTNDLIATFDTIAEAERLFTGKTTGAIGKVLSGNCKTTFGFKWMRKTDFDNLNNVVESSDTYDT